MGILTNALAIALGGLFGGKLQSKSGVRSYETLGITSMMISLVGFLENMYNVQGNRISSTHLIVVLIAYMLGSRIGEEIRLEERLSDLGNTSSKSFNAFLDTAMFFGVGGLQISGSIALAVNGDSTQLFIKTFVDLPFAIAFGAAYGKITALAALPVALLQGLLALTAWLCVSVFTPAMTDQLCALGYVILFFSGFNLLSDGKNKISNINMLPGVFLVVLINVLIQVWERLI